MGRPGRRSELERRLDSHEAGIIRLQEQNKTLREVMCQEMKTTRDLFTEKFAPIKTLTERHDRAILSLEKDMSWIKPWFKRSLYGGGILALLGLGIKYLGPYVKF